jgi:hypothetical protein
MKYPLALALVVLASGLMVGCGSDSTPAPTATSAPAVPVGTQVPISAGAKKESIVAQKAMPLPNAK